MSVKSELTKALAKVNNFALCLPIIRDIIAVCYGIYDGIRECIENPRYDRVRYNKDTKPYYKDELEDL